MVKIVVVVKNSDCVTVDFETYTEDKLYRKCNFRKSEGFKMQATWKINIKEQEHTICLYGKINGKHNTINNFEFPPPVDKQLFYGNCAIVNFDKNNNVIDIDCELWFKLYEKLLGGFYNLKDTEIDDNNEVDELDNIAKEYKTKDGFLKDGFIVDSDSDSVETGIVESHKDVGNIKYNTVKQQDTDSDSDLNYEYNGSDLEPEEYSYSSDEDESKKKLI
jgi:hypothetical protein